jgi:hypothetical protein
MFIVALGQGFHVLEASSVTCVRASAARRAGVEVHGRSSNGLDRNLGEPCRSPEEASNKPKRRGGGMAAWQSDQPIVEA